VGEGCRIVRPIRVDDLPKEVQAEARRLAGMRPKVHRERQPKASNVIPASWTVHKECGWGGTGECIYCGGEDESSQDEEGDLGRGLS
jgi:hypothetical protein